MKRTGSKLPRDFYARNTLVVARELLGMHLCRQAENGGRYVGRIVETEAYKGPDDRACHAWHGRTPRTAILFGPPGYAYVYLIYGMYHCLNFVTEKEGYPAAVLIRAVEPIEGLRDKTSGPGLLCRAMQIDRGFGGIDLCGQTLWLEQPPAARRLRVGRSPRIGVDYAGSWAERPWRFFDRDSQQVSTARGSRAQSRRTRPLSTSP